MRTLRKTLGILLTAALLLSMLGIPASAEGGPTYFSDQYPSAFACSFTDAGKTSTLAVTFTAKDGYDWTGVSKVSLVLDANPLYTVECLPVQGQSGTFSAALDVSDKSNGEHHITAATLLGTDGAAIASYRRSTVNGTTTWYGYAGSDLSAVGLQLSGTVSDSFPVTGGLAPVDPDTLPTAFAVSYSAGTLTLNITGGTFAGVSVLTTARSTFVTGQKTAGTNQYTFAMQPQGAAGLAPITNGTYAVTGILLSDAQEKPIAAYRYTEGNTPAWQAVRSWFNSEPISGADMSAQGKLSFTVQDGINEDETPTLTGLTFDSAAVDANAAGAAFSGTVTLSDDSGVSSYELVFTCSDGGALTGGSFVFSGTVPADASWSGSKTLAFSRVFSAESPVQSGDYYLNSYTLTDVGGNSVYYYRFQTSENFTAYINNVKTTAAYQPNGFVTVTGNRSDAYFAAPAIEKISFDDEGYAKTVTAPGTIALKMDYTTPSDTSLNYLEVQYLRKGSGDAAVYGRFVWRPDDNLGDSSVSVSAAPGGPGGTVTIRFPISASLPQGTYEISTITIGATNEKGNSYRYFVSKPNYFPQAQIFSAGWYDTGKCMDSTGRYSAAAAPTAGFAGSGTFDFTVDNTLTEDAVYNTKQLTEDPGECVSGIGTAVQNGSRQIVISCVSPVNGTYYVADPVIPKAVFEAIAGKDVRLIVTLDDVQWVFDGKTVDAAKAKDVHVDVTLSARALDGLGFGEARGLCLTFADNGELPGPAVIRFNTDYLRLKYGSDMDYSALKVSYLSGTAASYERNVSGLAADGFVEFTVTHNSAFIIAQTAPAGSSAGTGGSTGANTGTGGNVGANTGTAGGAAAAAQNSAAAVKTIRSPATADRAPAALLTVLALLGAALLPTAWAAEKKRR